MRFGRVANHARVVPSNAMNEKVETPICGKTLKKSSRHRSLVDLADDQGQAPTFTLQEIGRCDSDEGTSTTATSLSPSMSPMVATFSREPETRTVRPLSRTFRLEEATPGGRTDWVGKLPRDSNKRVPTLHDVPRAPIGTIRHADSLFGATTGSRQQPKTSHPNPILFPEAQAPHKTSDTCQSMNWSNMDTALHTQHDSRPRSMAIAIQRRDTPNYYMDYPEDHEASPDQSSSEMMYDSATWRMYHRIVDHRRNQASKSPSGMTTTTSSQPQQAAFAMPPPATSGAYGYSQFESGAESESSHDGEIFELEM